MARGPVSEGRVTKGTDIERKDKMNSEQLRNERLVWWPRHQALGRQSKDLSEDEKSKAEDMRILYYAVTILAQNLEDTIDAVNELQEHHPDPKSK